MKEDNGSPLELLGAIYALFVSVFLVLPLLIIFLFAVLAHVAIYREYNQPIAREWGLKFAAIISSCRRLHGLIEI